MLGTDGRRRGDAIDARCAAHRRARHDPSRSHARSKEPSRCELDGRASSRAPRPWKDCAGLLADAKQPSPTAPEDAKRAKETQSGREPWPGRMRADRDTAATSAVRTYRSCRLAHSMGFGAHRAAPPCASRWRLRLTSRDARRNNRRLPPRGSAAACGATSETGQEAPPPLRRRGGRRPRCGRNTASSSR